MVPTSCIHWRAERTDSPVQFWAHYLDARLRRRRDGRREFKSKFGVRSGVHLSVHLRSVMRSAESFSREKHLITTSVLRAPVAFRKEGKSLFSRGSEGKLITSAQTPGRGWDVSERTELHGRRHCQRLTRSCRELCPSSFITTSHIPYSALTSTVNTTLQTVLFCCASCSAKSATRYI